MSKHRNCFSKEDLGRQLTMKEFRALQLEMLDTIVSFCDEHHLQYCLSGGTLLGAVRHQGFIPWDDDIDINMPRPDAEKLIALTKGRLGKYRVTEASRDPFSPPCVWYRLYNMRYIIEDYATYTADAQTYEPLYLDIFPIDGYPEKRTQVIRYCRKLIWIKKLFFLAYDSGVTASTSTKRLLKSILRIPAKMIGKDKIKKWFLREACRYPYTTSKRVGATTSLHYLPREDMLREEYLLTAKVSFEGRQLCAPVGYDKYLSNLYGDYMKIPPVEKQNSGHDFSVFERKKRK